MADNEKTLKYVREAFNKANCEDLVNLLSPAELESIEDFSLKNLVIIYGIFEGKKRLGTNVFKIEQLSERRDLVCMHQYGRAANFMSYSNIVAHALAKFYKCDVVRAHLDEENKLLMKLTERAGYKCQERVYIKEVA